CSLNGGRHVVDQEDDLLVAVLFGAQGKGAQGGGETALEGKRAGCGELRRRRSTQRDVWDAGTGDRGHLGRPLPCEGNRHGDNALLHHVVGTGLATGRGVLI